MSPGHLYKSLRPEGKNKPGGRVGGALCGSKLEKPESCVDPFTSLPLAVATPAVSAKKGPHLIEFQLNNTSRGSRMRGGGFVPGGWSLPGAS